MKRKYVSNKPEKRYITKSGIRNLDIQKLLGQAVVNCITGNQQELWRICELAANQQRIESYRNRLHASIGDILKSKGREVTFTICH
jgi:hypothetical protein